MPTATTDRFAGMVAGSVTQRATLLAPSGGYFAARYFRAHYFRAHFFGVPGPLSAFTDRYAGTAGGAPTQRYSGTATGAVTDRDTPVLLLQSGDELLLQTGDNLRLEAPWPNVGGSTTDRY